MMTDITYTDCEPHAWSESRVNRHSILTDFDAWFAFERDSAKLVVEGRWRRYWYHNCRRVEGGLKHD